MLTSSLLMDTTKVQTSQLSPHDLYWKNTTREKKVSINIKARQISIVSEHCSLGAEKVLSRSDTANLKTPNVNDLVTD